MIQLVLDNNTVRDKRKDKTLTLSHTHISAYSLVTEDAIRKEGYPTIAVQ